MVERISWPHKMEGGSRPQGRGCHLLLLPLCSHCSLPQRVDAVHQLLLALPGLIQALLQNVLLHLVQNEVSQPPQRPTGEPSPKETAQEGPGRACVS